MPYEVDGESQRGFCEALVQMTQSIVNTRDSIQSLIQSQDLNTKDGISLLSLKHNVLLSYLQSLILVSSQRVLGQPLAERRLPQQSFSELQRTPRGAHAGDIIDSMVEGRVVLEKVKAMENKMRYQIEKLVRLADQSQSDDQNVLDDPLAFRPNVGNLADQDSENEAATGNYDPATGKSIHKDRAQTDEDNSEQEGDGIYHPPRLAPVPYVESQKSRKSRQVPLPSALTSLTQLDPHIESTSGLGGTPNLLSRRAKELKRMTEFEEENFIRLVMKKKDALRRRRDEEDIALGGTGLSSGRGRRGDGLRAEFDDVFRTVGRKRTGTVDEYEELRQKGKRGDALARSRQRPRGDVDEMADLRDRKRGRFERERANLKKKLSGKMRR